MLAAAFAVVALVMTGALPVVVEEIRARKRTNVGRCPVPGHSFIECDPEAATVGLARGPDEPYSDLERSDRVEKLIRALQALAAESNDSLRLAKAVITVVTSLDVAQT